MSKTLIIGASGQIGKMTTQKLLDNGETVVGLVRDKSKLNDIKSDKLDVVEGDLEQDFSHAFKGCDKVIFAAGSGGSTGADKTMLIDLWAACKAVDYAKAANVSQFVMVSSIGADDPSQGSDKMKPYLVAKHMADEHLINSGVAYTILRPGSLKDEDAKGGFQTAKPHSKDKMIITREDVADALVYLLSNQNLTNKTYELFNGDHSLEQAFA
ncbi:NAD-dependent epimerase/dehydratase [Paraglaciecola mesophila KMM 241]|uniref:NAD-dependent epimerase/dehydratase n=1 Tax=Paraglaciecola mesophila KMM 241 TaxID=1128912 RepID=K6ZQJ4_9ALTE|nr:SDR family oxidoreductase [Paraglaciecola mesophila]GAC25605.1 NAD-dependent epimerase/dehydratase [Paraglaciecola mesophila KMM 241]